MRTTKAFRWLALVVALVALASLVAFVASRREPTSDQPPSQGPWTVDGLSVGMTRDQCLAALGEPTFEGRHPDGRWRLCWDDKAGSVMAHLDRTSNLLIAAQGTHLADATGRVVVSPTTREDELVALLPGIKREEEYLRGAVLGVLPQHQATWYTLESGGVLYSVQYPDGWPLAVWASRATTTGS